MTDHSSCFFRLFVSNQTLSSSWTLTSWMNNRAAVQKNDWSTFFSEKHINHLCSLLIKWWIFKMVHLMTTSAHRHCELFLMQDSSHQFQSSFYCLSNCTFWTSARCMSIFAKSHDTIQLTTASLFKSELYFCVIYWYTANLTENIFFMIAIHLSRTEILGLRNKFCRKGCVGIFHFITLGYCWNFIKSQRLSDFQISGVMFVCFHYRNNCLSCLGWCRK